MTTHHPDCLPPDVEFDPDTMLILMAAILLVFLARLQGVPPGSELDMLSLILLIGKGDDREPE
jgi:hypothetical protein